VPGKCHTGKTRRTIAVIFLVVDSESWLTFYSFFIEGLEEFLIEKYFSFRGLVFQYYRHIFTKRLTK
jgi:hypothetical protein